MKNSVSYRLTIQKQNDKMVIGRGPMVKRLRHHPFTVKSWVRVPLGSPKRSVSNRVRSSSHSARDFSFCSSVVGLFGILLVFSTIRYFSPSKIIYLMSASNSFFRLSRLVGSSAHSIARTLLWKKSISISTCNGLILFASSSAIFDTSCVLRSVSSLILLCVYSL